jgi:hypothetical protein
MTLVPLVLDLYDGALNPVVAGTASLTPSVQLTDPGTGIAVESGPAVVFRPSSPTPLTWIIPTDASGWAPSGWGWDIAFSGVPGTPAAFSFKITSSGYLYPFTATSATPAVFTAAGSSLTNGTAVALTPGSSLPGGFRSGQVYYVVDVSGDTFSLAAAAGGSALPSTSAGSGTVGVVQYLSSFSPESDVVTTVAYAQVNAGDLDGAGGSSASPKVSGIQGVPVSATAPTSGQVLTYNGSEYVPEAGGGGGAVSSVFGRSGAVVATSGDYNVSQISGLGLVALTDAATIAVNAAAGSFFRVTLGGNRTLGTPSNPVDGQQITFEFIQDSTGSRTLAYSAAYAFPASIPQPSLSSSPGQRDFASFIYDAGETLWQCVGWVPDQNAGIVPIAQGGSGQSTQAAAITALTGTQTAGQYLRSNGTNAALAAIQAADLPAATTSAQGAVELTGTATDIQNTGTQAAGNSTKAAPANHVHFSSGQYLCAPSVYAPGSLTLLAAGSTTMGTFGPATLITAGSNGGEISAIGTWSSPSGGVLDVASTSGFPSSGTLLVATSTTTATITYTGTSGGNQFTGCAYVSGSATGTVATNGAVTQPSATSLISTGSFTAPASGSVVVTVNLVGYLTAAAAGLLGLAAHGTVTPMIGNEFNFTDSAATQYRILNPVFVVTGLTPGNSYNFDLLGAATGNDFCFIAAQAATSTTPTIGNHGGPVTMLVQAV